MSIDRKKKKPMFTKKTQIEQLIPIEMKVSETRINNSVKQWTNNGLSILFNLWHKYYNDNAHIVIGNTILTMKEKYVNFEGLEKCIKDVTNYPRKITFPEYYD